jgi:hypothetical protein
MQRFSPPKQLKIIKQMSKHFADEESNKQNSFNIHSLDSLSEEIKKENFS